MSEPTFCGCAVPGDRGGPTEACGAPLPCADHQTTERYEPRLDHSSCDHGTTSGAATDLAACELESAVTWIERKFNIARTCSSEESAYRHSSVILTTKEALDLCRWIADLRHAWDYLNVMPGKE